MASIKDALNRRLNQRFNVGAVVSATFMLAIRRIYIFLPMAVVCYLPMAFLDYGVTYASRYIILWNISPFLGLIRFVSEMLTDVFCTILFIAFALAHIRRIIGMPGAASGGSRALARIAPIYICGFLAALISWTGFIILIIPGLYLMIITWVAIPAAISDRLGPIAAWSCPYFTGQSGLVIERA